MKRIGLFLLLITIGFCSSNWFRINSTCFQANKTKVNQNTAIQLCQEKGAILHSIKNETEFTDLLPFLPKDSSDFWVWARKSSSGFKWGDGRNCCPNSWWRPGEPSAGEDCARLNQNVNLLLMGYSCTTRYGFLCSKPVGKWTLMKSTEYYWPDLCGVEIMPNCDGRSCEEVCYAHSNCNQFAKISNLCIRINNDSLSTDCIVKMRPGLQFYKWTIC